MASQIPLPTIHIACGLYLRTFSSTVSTFESISSLLNSLAQRVGRDMRFVMPTLYNAGRDLSATYVCFTVVIPEECRRRQNLFVGPANPCCARAVATPAGKPITTKSHLDSGRRREGSSRLPSSPNLVSEDGNKWKKEHSLDSWAFGETIAFVFASLVMWRRSIILTMLVFSCRRCRAREPLPSRKIWRQGI